MFPRLQIRLRPFLLSSSFPHYRVFRSYCTYAQLASAPCNNCLSHVVYATAFAEGACYQGTKDVLPESIVVSSFLQRCVPHSLRYRSGREGTTTCCAIRISYLLSVSRRHPLAVPSLCSSLHIAPSHLRSAIKCGGRSNQAYPTFDSHTACVMKKDMSDCVSVCLVRWTQVKHQQVRGAGPGAARKLCSRPGIPEQISQRSLVASR